mgnify:CR=1 FL=1
MYFRFNSRLEFPALAQALCADLTEDVIDWDSENVYEWMYVDLPDLDFSLNISREHGWADVDDEILDQHAGDDQKLREIVQPGPVYVFGWNRERSEYVDELPDALPSFIADRIGVDVSVFSGRINVDLPDGEPLMVIRSNTTT